MSERNTNTQQNNNSKHSNSNSNSNNSSFQNTESRWSQGINDDFYSNDDLAANDSSSNDIQTNSDLNNNMESDINQQSNNSHDNPSQQFPFNTLLETKKHKWCYSMAPEGLPRPCSEDLIFKNESDEPVFESKINNFSFLPYSISRYKNKEIDNSSLKWIRPSMHILPYDVSVYKKSKLKFGFNIEPFANDENETIPTIIIGNTEENIPQCRKCNAFYTADFKLKWENNSLYYKKYSFKCSVCKANDCFFTKGTEGNDNINLETMINEKDIKAQIPKLLPHSPSVDYIYQNESGVSIENILFFYIDVSEPSLKYGFAKYILDSLRQIIQGSDHKKFISYCFSLYNDSTISYYYYTNNTIKCTIMPDLNNPYCPITYNDMLSISNNNQTLSLIDLLQNQIQQKTEAKSLFPASTSCINSCIYSVFDFAKNNFKENVYFNIHVFSCNASSKGIMYFQEFMNHNHIWIGNEGYKLYTQQHEFIHNLNKSFISKHCSFYFFITGQSQNQVHLGNYSNYYYRYYPIHFHNEADVKWKYEKIYYDWRWLLNSDEMIYDVKYKLCCNTSKFMCQQVEIVHMNNKDNSNEIGNRIKDVAFSSVVNPRNLSFVYEIKQNQSLNIGEVAKFQFWIIFRTQNDNSLHLRVINYGIQATSDISLLYAGWDNDCLSRLILTSEISAGLNQKKIISVIKRNIITECLIPLLAFYKCAVLIGSGLNNFSWPFSWKFIIWYVYSFFQQRTIREISYSCLKYEESSWNNSKDITYHFNDITWSLYKLFKFPLQQVIKFIYPSLCVINEDDYISSQIGWGLLFIFPGMFIAYDDGDYVNIFIVYDISKIIGNKYFNMNNGNWTLLSNEELMNRFTPGNNVGWSEWLMNKPFKIEIIRDSEMNNKRFPLMLIEDGYFVGEESYSDFALNIKNLITEKICEMW